MRSLSRARRVAGLLALTPAAILAQTSAGPPPSGGVDQPLPFDTAVTVGTLPNGMHYYLRVNREPERRAELRLIVRAGSIHEADDQRGLAHFLEHMAFNGTTHFARQQLVEYLESIGMRFGGDVNATTTYDHTLYRLTVPTDVPGALERALLIVGDWAHGITLDRAAIDSERNVVLAEWRSRLGAATRVRLRADSLLLAGSRYLERNPIGLPERIATAQRAELVRFYTDWYRPERMAVVVVGDIDKTATEALIRRHFAELSRAGEPPALDEPTLPDRRGPLVTVITDPEATTWSVQLLRRYRPSPVNTAARAREELIEGLFESIVDRRLHEIATKAEAPFLGAGTDVARFVGEWKLQTVVAVTTRAGELERGLEAALTEVERVAQHGVTRAELEREQRAMETRFDHLLITRSKITSSSYADAYVAHFLTGAIPATVEAQVSRGRALLRTITAEDVAAVAKRWHDGENLALIAVVPEKAGAKPPSAESLRAVVEAVRRRPVSASDEAVVATKTLLTEPPAPGTVTGERRIVEIGVTEWTLSNGVHVFLKPTPFSPDQVMLAGQSWGGTSLLSVTDLPDAALAKALPAISGLGSFSATALRTALVGKLVTVGMGIGPYTEQVSGRSTARDVETLLQLVYLHFTAPRVDSEAVRAWQRRVRAELEGRASSPQSRFADSVSLTLTQRHPRLLPLDPAQIDSIDMARALAIYKDRFADASDFTFVIVGTFTLDSLRPLVARYLGGLPAEHRDEGWRDSGVRYPSGVVEKRFRFGREPRSRTAIVFHGPYVHSVDDHFAVAAVGEVLTMRLRERLREQLGGTYSVGVNTSIQSIPEPRYTVTITFDAAPERADELAAEVLAEVGRLRASGPTRAEVERVREEASRRMELAVKSNDYWLQAIMGYVQMERPLEGLAAADAPIKELTAARVHQMAKQYLDPGRYIRVTQLPDR